jgi:hypothetical protein
MTYLNPKIVKLYTRGSEHPAEQGFESVILFLIITIFLVFIGYLLVHYIVPCFMDAIVNFFYNSVSWERFLNPYD